MIGFRAMSYVLHDFNLPFFNTFTHTDEKCEAQRSFPSKHVFTLWTTWLAATITATTIKAIAANAAIYRRSRRRSTATWRANAATVVETGAGVVMRGRRGSAAQWNKIIGLLYQV